MVVLARSSLDRANDVLDLEAGTLYGFSLPTVAPADFVAGVVSGERGQPTFDSGWYTMESAPGVERAELPLGPAGTGHPMGRPGSWLHQRRRSRSTLVMVPGRRHGCVGAAVRDFWGSSQLDSDAAEFEATEQSRDRHHAGRDPVVARRRLRRGVRVRRHLADRRERPTGRERRRSCARVLKIGPTAIDVLLDHGTITWMSMEDATPC